MKHNILIRSWHNGDHNCNKAHLVALPVGLYTESRDMELDRSHLDPILSKNDSVGDILAEKFIQSYSTDVVRANLAATHDLQSQQSSGNWNHRQVNCAKGGHSPQKNIGTDGNVLNGCGLEAMNYIMVRNMEISEFVSSFCWVTLLRIFMYM